MVIFSVLAAAALAAGAPSEKLAGDEASLISASIDDLRQRLSDPRAAHFRRVHLFKARGQDGVTRTLLCGQVFSDDPRQPWGWTMFGAAETSAGFIQQLGPMAVRWCDRPDAAWDYNRDFA